LSRQSWRPARLQIVVMGEVIRRDLKNSWYFESCNCTAICPCRKIDGVPGGRSTHGFCTGVLSWLIEEGQVDDIDLSGVPIALALRYDDDERNSPWTWVLYERASERQRAVLEGIFTGAPWRRGRTFRKYPKSYAPTRCFYAPKTSRTNSRTPDLRTTKTLQNRHYC
jgi:hypothetical protein